MLDFTVIPLLVLCVALGAFALAFHVRRSLKSLASALGDTRVRVAELNEQVQMGEVVMQNQARRIERLGWELGQLSDVRRAPVATAAPVVTESSERINQAIKLARRGESVESLMSLCALGRGEAELLVKLHYRPAPVENGDAA